MDDHRSTDSEHAGSDTTAPSQARPVLEYRAPDKPKPLLARVNWKRFWQGFALAILYGLIAPIAWVFYADFAYQRRHLTPPPPHEVFAGTLALVFVLLVIDIHRRTGSWSFVCGAAAALLLVPGILFLMLLIWFTLYPMPF